MSIFVSTYIFQIELLIEERVFCLVNGDIKQASDLRKAIEFKRDELFKLLEKGVSHVR